MAHILLTRDRVRPLHRIPFMGHLLSLFIVDAANHELKIWKTIGFGNQVCLLLCRNACFPQSYPREASFGVDTIHMKMLGEIETGQEQRKQSKCQLAAILQLAKLLYFFFAELKPFTAPAHGNFYFRCGEFFLPMLPDHFSEFGQQRIKAAPPDSRCLEKAANQPFPNTLAILRMF